jgi:hypothetical protein
MKAMWVNVLLVVVLAGSLTMLVGCYGSNPLLDLYGTHWYGYYLALTQYAQVLPIYNINLDFGIVPEGVKGQVAPAQAQGNASVFFSLYNAEGSPVQLNGSYTQTGSDFTINCPAPGGTMVPHGTPTFSSVTVSGYVVDPNTLTVTGMTLEGDTPPGTWTGGSLQLLPDN